MKLSPDWEYVADTVMGGVSEGAVSQGRIGDRDATRLTGRVSLDNNGGFIQMAADLGGADVLDASDWTGVELDVCGNDEVYEVRLRTDQLSRPWQSYRAEFTAGPDWHSLRLPFAAFEQNKTDVPFDPARLRRIGIVAYGRAFDADVAVSGLRLYRGG